MTDPAFRTPVGSQSETHKDTTCDRCGEPCEDNKPKWLYGRDKDSPSYIPVVGGNCPNLCHACLVAGLSGTGWPRTEASISILDERPTRCEYCGEPMEPGRGKRVKLYHSRACQVAAWRRKKRESA